MSGYEKFEAESTQKELAIIEIQREVLQKVHTLGHEALLLLIEFYNYRNYVGSLIEFSEYTGNAGIAVRETGTLLEIEQSAPIRKAEDILQALKRISRDLSALELTNKEVVPKQAGEWAKMTSRLDLGSLYQHTGPRDEQTDSYVKKTSHLLAHAILQEKEANERRWELLN